MKKVDVNNVQLAAIDQGTGQPVVLLHGYPLDHRMWEPQIDALSKSCRVIAPDLRGFGSSTLAPEDPSRGVSMEKYAADVSMMLQAMGVSEPVILCGFSMGGYILWQFVRQFPEQVKGIVACDTRAIADAAEVREGRIKTANEVFESGVDPVVATMLPKLLSKGTFSSRTDIVNQVTAIMQNCSAESISAALRGMADRPDVTNELPKFSQPALVLVGAEDAISSPQEMRGIAEKLPHAEFVEIPESGHMTTLENPAAVNEALLGFVRSLT